MRRNHPQCSPRTKNDHHSAFSKLCETHITGMLNIYFCAPVNAGGFPRSHYAAQVSHSQRRRPRILAICQPVGARCGLLFAAAVVKRRKAATAFMAVLAAGR